MKRKIFLILFGLIIIHVISLNKTEVTIPDAAIRLRVIPNSNSAKDIAVKEEVKDYLESDVYTLLKDTKNIETARTIIENNIPTIESSIDSIFLSNNYSLDYQVNFGYNYFPEKIYHGETYKEGFYESLVISIGEAEGDNWWCVLFPNFCLVDTKEDYVYKSYLKELINKIF